MTVWMFMQLVQQLAGEVVVRARADAGKTGPAMPAEAQPILETRVIKVMRRRRFRSDKVIALPIRHVGLDDNGDIVVVIDK